MIHSKRYSVFTLIFLDIVLLIGFYFVYKARAAPPYPELKTLEELAASNADFTKISSFFVDLAHKKGAVYAYDVLRIAPMPPDIDMHLLGHAVGDVLYKQKGADGIRDCTQDFRNACSHSIVVGLYLEKGGDAALPEITAACKQAPGGSGAYFMCYHGLGHGILAASGYDLEKTVQSCKKTVSEGSGGGELSQCVSGGIMEIVGGGFHDKTLWEKQRPKYLSANHPLSICNLPYIPKEAQAACYDYLTPYLIEAVGGDMGHPTPESFTKAFTLCNAVPVNQPENRSSCFGGFGKEFTALAKQRDIRNINAMTELELKQVYAWCKLAPHEEARVACIAHALSSLFWGGENDPAVSVRFCSILDASSDRTFCFDRIFELSNIFLKDSPKKQQLCNVLPADQKSRCQQ